MTPCTLFFKFIFPTMYLSMFKIISTKLKIVNTIIRRIIINMMYMFFTSKIPTNIFFYHKAMFHNIPFTTTSKRMSRYINKNISFFRNIFPFKIYRFSTLKSFFDFILSFLSHWFSFIHSCIIYNKGYRSIVLCGS